MARQRFHYRKNQQGTIFGAGKGRSLRPLYPSAEEYYEERRRAEQGEESTEEALERYFEKRDLERLKRTGKIDIEYDEKGNER